MERMSIRQEINKKTKRLLHKKLNQIFYEIIGNLQR